MTTFYKVKASTFFFLFFFIFWGLFFSPHAEAFEPSSTFQTRCFSCHNIGEGPKVGPDLKDVWEKRSQDWLISFIQSPKKRIDSGDPVALELFNQYNKVIMPDHEFSSEEVKVLLKFIQDYGEGKVPQFSSQKALPFNLGLNPPVDKFYIFIFLILVLTLLFLALWLDRLYERKPWLKIFRPKRLVSFGIGVVVFIVGSGFLIKNARELGYGQYYQPEQPIAYSHRIHAGVNQMDCQYCHYASEISRYAGIPAASVCMNCHKVVKLDSPEVKKIAEAIDKNTPIAWVRIHQLPDFVYFNHAQHVVAGKIKCQTCHGPVEKMDRVFQYAPLSMGWCIDCHRTEKIKEPGPFQGETVEQAGGLDCNRCHY